MSGGFNEPSEGLMVLAILGILTAIAVPIAQSYGLGFLAALGMAPGAFGFFLLGLHHQSLRDWLREKKSGRDGSGGV